jgi:WD40 repeat protein
MAVAFNPDGKTVLTGSGDNTARLWLSPPQLSENIDPTRLKLWVECVVNMYLNEQELLLQLSTEEWFKRRLQLDKLLPVAESGKLLQP